MQITRQEKQPRITYLPINQVEVRNQVRSSMDKDALAELADDIRQHGVMQPLLVRPLGQGRYCVIAGHRRRFASEMAGLKEIPAIVGQAEAELVMEMQLAENIQREELNDMDIGKAVSKLYEKYASLDTVALIVNKSKSWVSKHIKLAERLHWRATKLFEDGITEDGEYLTTLSDLFSLLDYAEVHKLDGDVRAHKIDRHGARNLLAAEKAKRAATPTPTSSTAKKPAKPKKLNLVGMLRALEYADGPVADIIAQWDEKQEQALRAHLAAAFNEGFKIDEPGPAEMLSAARVAEYQGLKLARFMGLQAEAGQAFDMADWMKEYDRFKQPSDAE